MPPEARQLPLALRLRDDATFDNFWTAPAQQPVLQALHDVLRGDGGGLYLFGAEGSGRSHLLQAACHALAERGAIYLPLGDLVEQNPQTLLEDLSALSLLCLDDLERVSGRMDWAEALFHAFNRALQSGQCLLIAAACNPASLDCALPDLRSRLAWLDCYRLPALDDDERLRALQWRARRRGLQLGEETARFMLNHLPRDCASLFAFLDRLDRHSLAAQRRLTIPFVRELLSQGK